eukprot:9480207-Pyramimonas_sp.AAC.1
MRLTRVAGGEHHHVQVAPTVAEEVLGRAVMHRKGDLVVGRVREVGAGGVNLVGGGVGMGGVLEGALHHVRGDVHAAEPAPVLGQQGKHHRGAGGGVVEGVGGGALGAHLVQLGHLRVDPLGHGRPVLAAHLQQIKGADDVGKVRHRDAHPGGGSLLGPRHLGVVVGLAADSVHRQGLGGGLAGVVEGEMVRRHHAALLALARRLHNVHGVVEGALANLVGAARAVVVTIVGVQHLDNLVASGAVKVQLVALRGGVAHQPDDAVVHVHGRVLGHVPDVLVEAVVRHQVLEGAGAVARVARKRRAVRVGGKMLRLAHLVVHADVVNLAGEALAHAHGLRVAAVELGGLIGEGRRRHSHRVEVQVEVETVVRHRQVRPRAYLELNGRLADAENLRADVHAALQGVLASHASRGQQRQPVALARVLRLLRDNVLAGLARVRALADEGVDGEVGLQVQRVRIGEHGGHRHVLLKVQGGAVDHLEAMVAATAVGVVGLLRQSAVLVVRLGAAAASVATGGAHSLSAHADLITVPTARSLRYRLAVHHTRLCVAT